MRKKNPNKNIKAVSAFMACYTPRKQSLGVYSDPYVRPSILISNPLLLQDR